MVGKMRVIAIELSKDACTDIEKIKRNCMTRTFSVFCSVDYLDGVIAYNKPRRDSCEKFIVASAALVRAGARIGQIHFESVDEWEEDECDDFIDFNSITGLNIELIYKHVHMNLFKNREAYDDWWVQVRPVKK